MGWGEKMLISLMVCLRTARKAEARETEVNGSLERGRVRGLRTWSQ